MAVHLLLECFCRNIKTGRRTEKACELRIAPGEVFLLPHEGKQFSDHIGEKQLRRVKAVAYRFPCVNLLAEPQLHLTVRNVSAGTAERGSVGTPSALVENKHGIGRTADSGRAGDLVQRVAVPHLTEVVYQQDRNAEGIGKPFDRTDFFVIVGIRTFRVRPADELEGVDHHKRQAGMRSGKVTDLLFQAFCHRPSLRCEEGIAGDIIGDVAKSLLNPAQAVLQTKIQCRAFVCFLTEEPFAFGDLHAEVEHQP